MIIQDNGDEIICIEQHEHALISGQFVHHWRDEYFLGNSIKHSVEYAVANHDRSWIQLDKKPVYLPEKGSLASFTDYPMEPKLKAYKNGIVQLLKEDMYAGYLLSCHYASFFKNKSDVLGNQFMKKEEERQQSLLEDLLKKQLLPTKEEREFHFDLLQLCDNLSLYICMNKWGTSKEKEISWFKDGFQQKLFPLNFKSVYTEFKSDLKVAIEPFPFKSKDLRIVIPFKRLYKKDLTHSGNRDIYREAKTECHSIVFTDLS